MSSVIYECVMSMWQHLHALLWGFKTLILPTCSTGVRHVTYKWVISHMNASCPYDICMREEDSTWMSHVTYAWMSHVTYECIMSIWRVHAWWRFNMNKSCHICMNESCHTQMSHVTYECIMCQYDMCLRDEDSTRMSHVTYEWDMSHMNESCQIWVNHVT